MRTSTLRLHSVRFKDGRAPIEVIRPRYSTASVAEKLATASGRMIECLGSAVPVGYVLVCWEANGQIRSMRMGSNGNPIPSILVPDFVRNALLADTTEDWTIDAINKSRGF